MNSFNLSIVLLFVLFLFCCCLQSDERLVCNKPYIAVPKGCCLDLNDNTVCDSLEATTTISTTTSTTSTTTSSTTTASRTTTTTSTTTSTIPQLSGGPSFINGFRAYEDEDSFVAFFYFTNESGGELPVEGVAYLNLSDGERLLYSGKINVSRKNYINTTIGFGNALHLLCIIRVPLHEVELSRLTVGRADLVFALRDGSYFSADFREVAFPRSTDSDLLHYSGSRYMESAKRLDIVQTRNNVSVTLVGAGYYYKPGYDESNGTRYLRVDLEVRNLGEDKISFNSDDALVKLESTSYDLDSGTVDVRDMYGGRVGGGYLLFKGLPDLEGADFDILAGRSIDETGRQTEFYFHDVLFS
jgi:hypothetical protein